MRENGSPDPEFFNPEARSFMTVILPIHEAFKAEIVEKVSGSKEKSTEKNGLKTTEKNRYENRHENCRCHYCAEP